jgi:L-asparagine transporter-like permease
MKTMYKMFMFFNLFIAAFYGLGVIFSIFKPETEFNIWNALAVPAFLLFYFLFRKKHLQLVQKEEKEKRTQLSRRPTKKKRK